MQTKVVIVEDNPITVRSLVETIDWDKMNCVIAGTARDGESGRKLLMEKKPDILLTDIRMPREDGLQMLEEVRPLLPDLKVIIITGYDKFQYASQAIKLAVFDYILKPIQNEEVIRAVLRAIEANKAQQEKEAAIMQVDTYRKKAQLLSLLTNDAHAGQDVSLMMEEAGLRAPAFYLMIIQPREAVAPGMSFMDRVDRVLSTCGINAVTVAMYDSMVVYVMRDSEDDTWRREAMDAAARIENSMPGQTHIGISALTTSRHQIRTAYQQARQALWEDAMRRETAPGRFYGAGDLRGDSPVEDMRRRVEELITNADLSPEYASGAAKALVEISGRQYSYLRALVSLYAILLIRRFSRSATERIDQAMSRVWYVTNEENVAGCLKNLSEALRLAEEGSGSCSLLVKAVTDYIRLHGAESLRLGDVADRFHVSANYLSAVISRETGITFHEHVLRAKMEIAHTLLADPRILVEEVARAVGYSNYISFYNTFKRLEHMTPSEYRSSLAKE